MSSNPFRSAILHRSLSAAAQSRRRAESLQSGIIDHAFHYGGTRQGQLWLEVHRRHAPMFADSSFESIYRTVFERVAHELSGRALHVIGLGVGGGQKEAWLLQALHAAGCRLRYTPIDASADLAFLSAEAARPFVNGDIEPIIGHLSLLADLPHWLGRLPADELRVFTVIGLVHNFAPNSFMPWLRDVMRPQDRMVLSANLAPVGSQEGGEAAYAAACARVLPQYENSETRAWLRQILWDWNLAEHLAEPGFSIETIEGIRGFVARSAWLRNVAFDWEGEPFCARAGDSLKLFFSLRFTPASLADRLAGFSLFLEQGEVTACGQEGVWSVRRNPG